MLSLAKPEVMPSLHASKGITPPALQPLMSWFRHTFQQLPPALRQTSQGDGDEFAGPANGVETVVEQLQAVALAKQGAAEQLQTLFVALCRAQGLLVRSVRCVLPH